MQYAWKNTKYRTMAYKPTKERYIYSAWEMGKYLGIYNDKYKINSTDDIKNKQGIIYFYNYHIDLVYWDTGMLYDSAELVGNRSAYVWYMMWSHTTYFMPLDD